MKRLMILAALGLVAASNVNAASPEIDQYKAAADVCVKTNQPDQCMKPYGFDCAWISPVPNQPDREHYYSCNARMADGRYYFVQFHYKDGAWSISDQHAYTPDP